MGGESVTTLPLWPPKSLLISYSVDSRNLKKWGRSPTTAQNVGEGLKILGDDFMIKFKLMENTFSVYLDIFNSGLPLISDQGHLIGYPISSAWLSTIEHPPFS